MVAKVLNTILADGRLNLILVILNLSFLINLLDTGVKDVWKADYRDIICKD